MISEGAKRRSGPIRVAAVDDHPCALYMIEGIARLHADLTYVGGAQTGCQASGLVESTRPHVLVLDLVLPDIDGAQLARQLRALAPSTRILIYTGVDAERRIPELRQAGATGYLSKTAGIDEIAGAIRAVAAGGVAFPARGVVDGTSAVTQRERQILWLLNEGETCAQIASRLCITENTVETHTRHLYRKLGAGNRWQALRNAERQGIWAEPPSAMVGR